MLRKIEFIIWADNRCVRIECMIVGGSEDGDVLAMIAVPKQG